MYPGNYTTINENMNLNQQPICRVGLMNIEGKKGTMLNEVEILIMQWEGLLFAFLEPLCV